MRTKDGRDALPSIVVLPFDNISGDKENEYFSDGLGGGDHQRTDRTDCLLFFLHAHATALRSAPRWPALAKMMNFGDGAG